MTVDRAYCRYTLKGRLMTYSKKILTKNIIKEVKRVSFMNVLIVYYCYTNILFSLNQVIKEYYFLNTLIKKFTL